MHFFFGKFEIFQQIIWCAFTRCKGCKMLLAQLMQLEYRQLYWILSSGFWLLTTHSLSAGLGDYGVNVCMLRRKAEDLVKSSLAGLTISSRQMWKDTRSATREQRENEGNPSAAVVLKLCSIQADQIRFITPSDAPNSINLLPSDYGAELFWNQIFYSAGLTDRMREALIYTGAVRDTRNTFPKFIFRLW